jgi:hypothetical protein
MDGPRHQLLPRAGLPLDQDGDVARLELAEGLHHSAHGGATHEQAFVLLEPVALVGTGVAERRMALAPVDLEGTEPCAERRAVERQRSSWPSPTSETMTVASRNGRTVAKA